MDSISLVIVLMAALITPLIMARFHISMLPTAVVEILVGIILGPSLFNIVSDSNILSILSKIGVIVLLFLSGMEIDFSLFKPKSKNPSELEKKSNKNAPRFSSVQLAFMGYATVIILSLILGYFCKLSGLFSDFWLASILFATISLGVVIAALKEKDVTGSAFGQTILLIAALGEVLPIFALTIYASVFGKDSKSLWLILILFVVAGFLLWWFKRFFKFSDQINKSTTQIDIRLAFFIIVLLSTIAVFVGSEDILGAFIGGMVYKLLQPSETTKDRLDSIGYGLFIPVFFIMSGVGLNVKELLSNPATLILIPVFFASYIISKLGLYPIFRLRFNKRNSLAGMALPSATITMVLAILQVAKGMKVITSQQSGAFLLAAIITCILGPLVFNKAFKVEPETYPKIKVNFFGVNLTTIPVAQQLSTGWYDVNVYTDNEEHYRSYNSQANVHLVDKLDPQFLIKNGYFDCDITVMAYFDSETSYELAKAAKKYGVRRVIARFENRDVLDQHKKELLDLGVEIYNNLSVNIAMLRELIEVPSTFKMIESNESVLHEVKLTNPSLANTTIKSLPFSNDITINEIFRDHQPLHPTGNTTLMLGDQIIFSAKKGTGIQIRNEFNPDE